MYLNESGEVFSGIISPTGETLKISASICNAYGESQKNYSGDFLISKGCFFVSIKNFSSRAAKIDIKTCFFPIISENMQLENGKYILGETQNGLFIFENKHKASAGLIRIKAVFEMEKFFSPVNYEGGKNFENPILIYSQLGCDFGNGKVLQEMNIPNHQPFVADEKIEPFEIQLKWVSK